MLNDYSEDKLIQETTSNYLRDQLGWETAHGYNTEVLGAQGSFGRENEKEVVLVRYLRQALEKLNSGLPAIAYEEAVRAITEENISKSLVQRNQEKYALYKEGVPVSFKNAQGKIEKRRLRLFDFNHPENNHFLAIRELWVQGQLYRRRPDIIGFVNGLPLLFIELKNLHKDIRLAYEKNLSDYKDTVPHLFTHNAFIVLSNGDQGKIGSVTSKYEHFHDWKRLIEEDSGSLDFETLLKGVCGKQNFMDLLENFTLFDDSSGKLVKILARNHQFLGVNRALAAMLDRDTKEGKLGIFWHTQGSGKSYSMIFYCQKIHRRLPGNYTFVIVTDRVDLDKQIYKTYAGVGAVKGKQVRATSGERLEALLKEDHRYLFTTIHKFNKEPDHPYSERDDIIVISDEAHRTQYGRFAMNMRKALPNASFIGFTGTPLFSNDQITRRIFGDEVSTYNFKRAYEDGATVPLFYENRGEKLEITDEGINQKILDTIDEFDLDEDQEAKLQRDLAREYHVVTSQERLDKVARDVVTHYTARWTTGKAMVVCIDKITAVRMYELIKEYWKEEIDCLEKRIKKATDEQEEQELRRKLTWMKESEYAVVVSEEQNEVKRFEAWDLDIKPHREKMKKRDLDEEFKQDEHPFRLAIVCAMWLTGFDVPNLSTLYLDKPLKAHTLMQTIARANRVYEGKNNGLIVDYIGILKSLRKALATYATGGTSTEAGDADPIRPKEELIEDLQEAIGETAAFLRRLGFELETLISAEGFDKIKAIKKAVEAAYTSDETRKKFELLAREVFRKFKAVLPDPAIERFQASYQAIDVIYKQLQENRENADISEVMKALQDVVSSGIETTKTEEPPVIIDISQIDFEKLRAEFARSEQKNTAVQMLKDRIEAKLQKMLDQNPSRIDYYQRYQEIIEAYNREKDRASIEKTFEDLLAFIDSLSEEEQRAIREGLSEEYLAVYDLLKKPELSGQERKKIKKLAQGLLDELKHSSLAVANWREKTTTTAAVKSDIFDFLFNELPPEYYSDHEVGERSEMVFQHVYLKYGEVREDAYT